MCITIITYMHTHIYTKGYYTRVLVQWQYGVINAELITITPMDILEIVLSEVNRWINLPWIFMAHIKISYHGRALWVWRPHSYFSSGLQPLSILINSINRQAFTESVRSSLVFSRRWILPLLRISLGGLSDRTAGEAFAHLPFTSRVGCVCR